MKFVLKENEKFKQQVENMSIDELLKIVVCPNLKAHDIHMNAAEDDVETLTAFVHPHNRKEEIEAISELKTNHNARLICTDIESGPGGAVLGEAVFPSIMGWGVADDEDLVYEAGKITADIARDVGFNWTFAPCVDILGDMDSPVISYRSPGETPEKVIKIGGAYMRGLQEHGLIATLKHFPGDGLCRFDQHVTTPDNPLPMDKWYETYGRVYKELIDQGAITVMPGHIALPAYDDLDEEMGMYPPATLSPKLMKNLLRDELGFEGIIVSDAVTMGGLASYTNYYEACARFLEAGGDCLLFSHLHPNFKEGIKKSIDKGLLSIETLKNRAYRMLCFAEQCENYVPKVAPDKEKSEKIAEELTFKSMAVARDRKNVIPYNITRSTKVLHVSLSAEYDNILSDVYEEIKKYTDHVDQIIKPSTKELEAAAYNYDLIICSIISVCTAGQNVVRLVGRDGAYLMARGWMKLGTPVIFVAHEHPYFHLEYRAAADTVINTYGHTKYTAKYLLEGITGKFKLKEIPKDNVIK